MKPCKQNKLNLKGLYNFIIFPLSRLWTFVDNKCRTFNILRCDVMGMYSYMYTIVNNFDGVVLHFQYYYRIRVLRTSNDKCFHSEILIKKTFKITRKSNNVKLEKTCEKGTEKLVFIRILIAFLVRWFLFRLLLLLRREKTMNAKKIR